MPSSGPGWQVRVRFTETATGVRNSNPEYYNSKRPTLIEQRSRTTYNNAKTCPQKDRPDSRDQNCRSCLVQVTLRADALTSAVSASHLIVRACLKYVFINIGLSDSLLTSVINKPPYGDIERSVC